MGGQGGEAGTSYLLEFFISSKLHSNIGDDSGHIGSVPFEIASEALLSPNAHQCRDDASKLLIHTIYLDLCVCVCVCVCVCRGVCVVSVYVGSCTVTNIHCHEYSFLCILSTPIFPSPSLTSPLTHPHILTTSYLTCSQ